MLWTVACCSGQHLCKRQCTHAVVYRAYKANWTATYLSPYLLTGPVAPATTAGKRANGAVLSDTGKRSAHEISAVACASWPQAFKHLSKFATATKHCYPSSWRVCAYCGVAPMCQLANSLRKQGGHAVEEAPPYAAEAPHMRQQCYARAPDGTADLTTWNICE